MIDADKVSLPVCAFGAGLVHATMLALILPIAITLPAPGRTMTARLVAVDVKIVTPEPGTAPEPKTPPEPKTVAPDPIAALAVDPEPSPDAPPDLDGDIPTEAAGDITGALPEALVQDPASSAVAAVDAAKPPLPLRVMRDSEGNAELEVEPKPAAAPTRPVQRVAPKHAPFARTAPRPTANQETAPYKGSWDALLGK